MAVRVAVVDALPMFTRGVVATLGDVGQVVDVPQDVLEWVKRPQPCVILFAVLTDRDWAILAEIMRVRPDAAVVAVVAEPDPATYLRAVSAGAVGVLPRDASEPVVCDVFRATLAGRTILPVDVLRSLLAGLSLDRSSRPVSDQELDWLRQLADGTTVARLAQRAGYSERMMFRLLRGVYARIGADSRTRAIMRARDAGWL